MINTTKIEYKKIDEIVPYGKNPRINDQAVDAVASSIKAFGFKVPIVVDGKNEIVNGHTRYKAAIKLGLEEVPVIVADDLTPTQIKAFRLADNKVAEIAEWDEESLRIELVELEDLDFDMTEFGFEPIVLVDNELPDLPDNEIAKNKHVLWVDDMEFSLSDQQYELFIDRYEKFMNEKGSEAGFINDLLGENNLE